MEVVERNNFVLYIIAERVARVAELVDALDSKSSPAHTGCRFESDLWYKMMVSSDVDHHRLSNSVGELPAHLYYIRSFSYIRVG